MAHQDSISEIIKTVQKFCEERDWDQFHPPKDLAIGMSTEANELLDLFRFKTESQIQEKMSTPEFKEKVSDELADVMFFVLRFAQMNKIDIGAAVHKKLAKNAAKYPIETAKGSNRKYNE
ncbi:nucleotide pyrophosphohydrolase [Bdellovibrio sp. SKB1291214]|uniref:nucleotide pyrophosphohydrolase n=1 Tax=Bdellovibrio sp. SKB1291214 TaxID=1732569 RepID=UPI000B519D02|nr:nucleotide pyrophosphohydrolase [Bdellovibrio sp. SKB1291214]UYL09405.1 nucleotide pyrophosphohydrolase [Bdellovibrio sp. SKB1291214]